MQDPDNIFPACAAVVGSGMWKKVSSCFREIDDFETFRKTLSQKGGSDVPGFLADLVLLEWTINEVLNNGLSIPNQVDQLIVNPTLQVLRLSWRHLPSLLPGKSGLEPAQPVHEEEFVLIWLLPDKRELIIRSASNEDLLALKIVADDLELGRVLPEWKTSAGLIDSIIFGAVRSGLLVAPDSEIRRGISFSSGLDNISPEFLSSNSFTLQWHITQACDLRCRHCYDRSARASVTVDQGIKILDDLHAFCRDRHVAGAVSFSGGNPVMHPHFLELYGAASDRGFTVSILGNPCSASTLKKITSIQRPNIFQVSLEGLPSHNDFIRGQGHFRRVTEFLKVLRDDGVYSMVMLTLTRDNMGQVLPLAELLRGSVDKFHFNRLSMVGEGALLRLPDRGEYANFLESYVKSAEGVPFMGLKENLINIIRFRNGEELFGGCAGFGCGAAFNFLAVLSDGEVHACRKFPSRIGNIYDKSLAEIYDSEIALRYRSGCSECKGCPVRPVCGGCLASAYSHGLDIFEKRDPFCFMPAR